MDPMKFNRHPHRRQNILNGEWVLVSPHRTRRPWQGEVARPGQASRPVYDPGCYLCPGNVRANGERNPLYQHTFVFTNDFSALEQGIPTSFYNQKRLLIARSESGICRVVNFSPRHDLTLAEMSNKAIEQVVCTWQDEFEILAGDPRVKYVQIFENKGTVMGSSNPHPHGQLWAQEHVPMEVRKESQRFAAHFRRQGRTLLHDYLQLELELGERIVWENASFVAVVPFWAVWPHETLIIPRRSLATILDLKGKERRDLAEAIRVITAKYDNLFRISFPYSAGIHQAPCDGKPNKGWHMHMHFLPPLLRSATIKKFMVGYEMLAEPQRDITPEASAATLRGLPLVHYKHLKPE
jgi:UDPglucose--hexose-1-phosphate uridylyltransferase